MLFEMLFRYFLFRKITKNTRERGRSVLAAQIYTFIIISACMFSSGYIYIYYLKDKFIGEQLRIGYRLPILIGILVLSFYIGSLLALFISSRGKPIRGFTDVLTFEQAQRTRLSGELESSCQISVYREGTVFGSFFPVDLYLNGNWVGELYPDKTLEFKTDVYENVLTVRNTGQGSTPESLSFQAVPGGRAEFTVKGEAFRPDKTIFHKPSSSPEAPEPHDPDPDVAADIPKNPAESILISSETSSESLLSFCPFCGALLSEKADICLTCGNSTSKSG